MIRALDPIGGTRRLALVATAAAAIVLGAGPADAERRALLIGIDAYRTVQPLQGSRNDVDDMRAFVSRHWGYGADEIRVLLDGEATRAAILATIADWLVADAGSGDELLLYYSGHGYQQPDQDGDEADGLDETLVPIDVRVEPGGAILNMVTDDELAAALDSAGAADVTVIIDSCHSGTVTRSLLGVPPEDLDLSLIRTPWPRQQIAPVTRSVASAAFREGSIAAELRGAVGRRVVWSAVSAVQKALVDVEADRPGGVFTRRFIAGVAGLAADSNRNGVVTYAELLDHVQQESADYCKRHEAFCPLGLTPLLEAGSEMQMAAVGDAGAGRPTDDSGEFTPAAGATAKSQTAGLGDAAAEALTHGNGFELTVEIEPGAELLVGDRVQFQVQSARDGHLILLDINAKDELRLLYPNKHSAAAGRGGRVDAGRPLLVPDAYYGFEFRADEPTGEGTLIAIVTTDAVPIGDLLPANDDLQAIDRPSAYLANLAQRLRNTWHDAGRNRRVDWAMVHRRYVIRPGDPLRD